MKKNNTLYWLLGILLILYFVCAYTLNIKMDTTYVFDYFFSSDCPRVVEDLQNAFGWHDRIKVHPLFLMLIQPLFQLMKGIFSSNENGRIALQVLVATINCYGIYKIVYGVSKNNLVSYLSMLIYGTSFSTLIFASVTETFLYATSCFILLWYYVIYVEDKEMNMQLYIILIALGILSFAITITNIVSYSICVIWLMIRKRGFAKSIKYIFSILGCVAVCCVVLSMLQKLVFPNVTAFYDILLGRVENEEVKYMNFSVDFSRIVESLKVFFLDSLVAPQLIITNAGINMGEFGIWPGGCTLIFIIGLVIITGLSIKRKAFNGNPVLLPMLICIIFNYLLHLVYGVGYVFLYSAHWVFLFAIIIGIVYSCIENEKLKKVYSIVCIMLIMLELVDNIKKFRFIIKKAQYRFGFFEITRQDKMIFLLVIVMVAFALIIIFSYKMKKITNLIATLSFLLVVCYSVGVFITRIEMNNYMQNESADNVTYELPSFGKQIIYFNNNIFIGNRDILISEGFTGQIFQKGDVLYCNGNQDMKESFKIVAKDGCLYKDDVNGTILICDSTILSLPREYYFGMGLRTKYILYQNKDANYTLKNYETNEIIARNINVESIDTEHYVVKGKNRKDEIVIQENEDGIYLYRNGEREILDESMHLNIPDFSKYKYGDKLSILFYEVMINMTTEGPKPNFIVYNHVFYRDAALAAMVCLQTGNMHVMNDWVKRIDTVYDRARITVDESDNLGQVLFLQSLLDEPNSELIDVAIKEAKRITSDGMLTGIVDGANHPIYATGWLKFGLESLGMDSSEWKLDLGVEDNYADALWFYNTKEMQKYRNEHQYHCDTAWQYLDYARAHFYEYPIDQRDSKNNEFPMSYEVGSNAEYFKKIDKDIYKLKLATPHIWGAAEMYMYYINQ